MVLAAAKIEWYLSTVDKYCNKLKEVFSELSGFGNVAMEIMEGRESSVTGLNAGFLTSVEDVLRSFVYGADGKGGFMQYMSSIAISIALTFFLISVLQLVTEDRFTPEFLVKFFAKFIIAFCVILWSGDILKYIVEFGTSFATMVGQAASAVGGDSSVSFDADGLEMLIKNHEAFYYKDCVWEGYPKGGVHQGSKSLGFMGQIGPALGLNMEMGTLTIVHIASILITGFVLVIILTRIMELYVRGSFLPIAAALMSDDGWRGSGGRYIRKLLSLATQNAAILVIANIFGTMCNAALGDILLESIPKVAACGHKNLESIAKCETCLKAIEAPIDLPILKPMIICIIICVAGVSMMFKAANIVDDVWGAR